MHTAALYLRMAFLLPCLARLTVHSLVSPRSRAGVVVLSTQAATRRASETIPSSVPTRPMKVSDSDYSSALVFLGDNRMQQRSYPPCREGKAADGGLRRGVLLSWGEAVNTD